MHSKHLPQSRRTNDIARWREIARIGQIVLVTLGGILGILVLLSLLEEPTRAQGTGGDPNVRYITVTADLPSYDPTAGEGVTKTIYLRNDAAGMITLTFEISGTPPLTLTAGAALGDPARTYTATQTSWKQPVTYTVETGSAGYPALASYVATNADAARTRIAITYVRDVAAPSIPALVRPPNGTVTNVATIPFAWSAAADGSGSGVAGYNVDLGGQVYTTTDPLTTTTLGGEGVYAWTARAYDHVGLASAYASAWNVTIDTTPPDVAIDTPQPSDVLTTAHQPAVSIAGTATDGVGLARVEVTTGTTWVLATGTENWTYDWRLPSADNVPYTLRAWATDNATNQRLSSNVVVTVDTVAPTTAAAPTPDRSPWVTSTVVYDWPDATDGAGIAGYQVNVTNNQGYADVFAAANSMYIFDQAYVEGASYYARVRAVDAHGNVGIWSGPSTAVVPDLTAPTISSAGIDIMVNPAAFYRSGLALYYTNTHGAGSFAVIGNAADALSGLDRVTFSPAFGHTPPDDTDPAIFAGVYDVPAGATEGGVVTATVYDRAGNTVVQTYTYELDGTSPDSAVSALSYVTSSPIAVAWTVTDTQSGILSATLWYSYDGSWYAHDLDVQTGGSAKVASGTFYLARAQDGSQDGTYCFTVVAQDHLHNRQPAPSGSGDSCTLYNTQVPQSEVTWAPAYKTSTPITMTWVATPSIAPLVEVRLWVRFGGGTWQPTDITSDQTSGTFTFPASDGDGTYDFATVARDELGETEATPASEPFGHSDATTILDRYAPTSQASSPDYDNAGDISVPWTAADATSGVHSTTLWVKYGSSGTWTRTGLSQAGTSGTFTYAPAYGDGQYYFATTATDNAGNVEPAPTGSGDDSTIYDFTKPTGTTIVAPEHTTETTFEVSWSANDATSGIAFYTVEYSGTAYTNWQTWLANTTLNSATFTAPDNGDYLLRVTAYDRAGNYDRATAATRVGFYRISLPLALRSYVAYFEGPWEAEPNNASSQANGPLRSGKDYYGYPDDSWDYFSICTHTSGNITIDLTNHTGQGVQLQLRDQSGNLLKYVYGQPYHIDHTGQAGCYYIGIYTGSGYNSTTQYTLRVTYP